MKDEYKTAQAAETSVVSTLSIFAGLVLNPANKKKPSESNLENAANKDIARLSVEEFERVYQLFIKTDFFYKNATVPLIEGKTAVEDAKLRQDKLTAYSAFKTEAAPAPVTKDSTPQVEFSTAAVAESKPASFMFNINLFGNSANRMGSNKKGGLEERMLDQPTYKQ